jgi:putative Mg2+ transporter-C (MgtC) family protein
VTGEIDFATDVSFLLRLLAAALFAVPLGLEREASGKAAGLRTHMLVCFSAALFMGLADLIVIRYGEAPGIKLDPIEVLGAVVSGVSFLGAGTIFVSRSGTGVQGLTTAASVLATAGVGIAVGLGMYVLAAGSVAILFVILKLVALIPGSSTDQRFDAEPTDRE